jgi:hypothetical protein
MWDGARASSQDNPLPKCWWNALITDPKSEIARIGLTLVIQIWMDTTLSNRAKKITQKSFIGFQPPLVAGCPGSSHGPVKNYRYR